MANINIPQGPLIPPSGDFSTLYAYSGEVGSIIPPPLVPIIQQEIAGSFTSVAMSQDGSTAALGINSGVGYVNIYININTVWTLQATLIGTGNTGNSEQGTSVALSANGNIAVVGGPADNSNVGAVWVFKRSGTSWAQFAGPIVGSGAIGPAYQGYSVAISLDSTTIVVGGYQDNGNIGATWIFFNNGNSILQQTKLVGTGNISTSEQGISVAITGSYPNFTVVSGAYEDNSSVGAAWVFNGTFGVWYQVTKLVPQGMLGSYSYFGTTVSINGNTIAVSGPYDNDEIGAVWVFNFVNNSWTQVQKIIATGFVYGGGYEGYGGIVLTTYSSQLIISGPYTNDDIGGYWIFNLQDDGSWLQQGPQFTTTANTVSLEDFSSDIAVSGSGIFMLINSSNAAYFITYGFS